MFSWFRRKAPPKLVSIFPTKLTYGDLTLTIHADGTWEGNGPAWLNAIAGATHNPLKRDESLVRDLWMVARAVRQDIHDPTQIGAKP